MAVRNNYGLKIRTLEALKWTLISKFTGQLVSWISTFFVIRMLSPDDYGLMAMTMLSGKLLIVLARSGVGDGLIQAKSLEEEWIRSILGFLLLVNVTLCVLQFFLAPWISYYFGEPKVELLTKVSAFMFLLIPWITMPSSLLSRDIEFKQKSIVELLATLAAAGTTLILAYKGFGVWALISGVIIQMVGQVVGYYFVRPVPWPPSFKFRRIRHLIAFGSTVTASLLIWTLYNSIDLIIGGYFMDAATLGLYTTALQLVTMPMEKVMPIVNQVAFPVYSRIQTDRDRLNIYIRKTINLGSLVSFPVFVGISAVAVEFVPLVLGEKWSGLETPLILLGLSMPWRVITNMLSPALKSIGKAGVELQISMYALVVLTGCFYVGSRWGATGLAAGWFIGMIVISTISFIRVSRALEMRLYDLVVGIVPAAISSMLMIGIVRLVAGSMSGIINSWILLLLLIAIGAAVYIVIIWVFFNKEAKEAINLLKGG